MTQLSPTAPAVPVRRVASGFRRALPLLNPMTMARDLWSHHDLINQFTKRDIRSRHKGTVLGVMWALGTPLLQLIAYTFVFSTVLSLRWERHPGEGIVDDATGGGSLAYAVTLFCGFVVFSMFADPVGRGPAMISNRQNFVKKVVFPLQIFPVTAVGTAIFHGLFGLVLLVLANLLFFGTVSPTAWMFPLMLLPAVLLSLGLCWTLAALGVFLRDLREIVQVLVFKVLFFMTPIFYPLELVPERFRPVLLANPLTGTVENARRSLLWGEWPNWGLWGYGMVVGVLACLLGYAFFNKSKRSFADVI